jgi:hypothetical protein
MRSFAFLYLAVAASIALAIPAPLPAPDEDFGDIIASLSDDPSADLGPQPGPEPAPPPPTQAELEDDTKSQIVPQKHKRDLEKRYTSLGEPSGWFYVYQNLTAATEHPSYITYKSLPATTPDFAQACADFCTSPTVTGCTFFNVYTEKYGPNPEDQKIKCSLYALPSTADQATNDGQWRNNYRVTISGSYGYSRILHPDVPGYTAESVDGAIIGKRANPTDPDPYMGFASIPAADPSLCAAACEEKTAYNSRHPSGGTYRACNFFNFYFLVKNGVPYKTICSFYLIPFDSSYATNHGYTAFPDIYTIEQSWIFTRVPQQGTGGIVTVP